MLNFEVVSKRKIIYYFVCFTNLGKIYNYDSKEEVMY